MEESTWVKPLSLGGGENWKRNLNHARNTDWIGGEDRQSLERLRQEHKLAGSALKKQARALDQILPCYQAKGEMSWGSKEEIEKHLSKRKEKDRGGELKRKREEIEREEQELMMEEQEKQRRQEEEEEEKERKRLRDWEQDQMEQEDLAMSLWMLDEEMAAEKKRKKQVKKGQKMKVEKAECLEEKEEKEEKDQASSLEMLVSIFKDSWSRLCDIEITGLKVKMTNEEGRSKNFYLQGEEMKQLLGEEIESLERAFSSKVWISVFFFGGGGGLRVFFFGGGLVGA